jgi:hypothetical protein
MRKLLTAAMASLLLFAGVCHSQAPSSTPAAAEPNLQQFTSPDGHFRTLFPGTPSTETQNVPLQGGATAVMNEWYVETDNHNVSYMLMYNDYPANYANGTPEDMLIKFRDGAIANKTLLTDAPISLNGVPGRAFTCKDSDGWLYDVHHYFLNKRLYQIIIVSAPNFTPFYRDAFMNSFTIIQ